MEEKTFEQLNRVFEALCEKYDPSCRCKAPDGKKCPCFYMNCCNLPVDEVTKQDLLDGIRVLQKELSGKEEEQK